MSPLPKRRHVLATAAAALVPTLVTLSGCGRKPPRQSALPAGATVLVLGDSLTSGVGTTPEAAYPALLQQRTGWHVVNAGVSGNTSAQGRERLGALLAQHRPALVIVGLGGNDFLRRVSTAETREHLRAIVQASRDAGAQVLLVAMPAPTLLAAAGHLQDHALYAELANALQVPLHAKGWSEVLSDERLRADAIHANSAGHARFAEGLEQTLRRVGWWR
ncbi:MAG: arylesterase [Burkholderiaceae bacterium]